MTFAGFTEQAFDFYEGLRADNSKAYWTAHKDVYEAAVRGPMRELLESLASTFDGEPMLFRPYRDVRFSKDKSPYKTQQGGFLAGGAAASATGCNSMPTASWSAVDSTRMTGRRLERFRSAINEDTTGAAAGHPHQQTDQGGVRTRRRPDQNTASRRCRRSSSSRPHAVRIPDRFAADPTLRVHVHDVREDGRRTLEESHAAGAVVPDARRADILTGAVFMLSCVTARASRHGRRGTDVAARMSRHGRRAALVAPRGGG